MSIQWSTYLRWVFCAVLGVPLLVLAYTPVGLEAIRLLGLDPENAKAVAAFVAAGLVSFAFVAARRTVGSGVARASWLRREWDAGGSTVSPWRGLELGNLERRTLVVASPRQAQRVQRALIRQGGALSVPVLTVQMRPDATVEPTVEAARREYARLVGAGRNSGWEGGRPAVFLLDLSSANLSSMQLQSVADTIRSWEELWPARSVVVFVAEDAVGEFRGIDRVVLRPDRDAKDAVPAPLEAPEFARAAAQVRGPLLLATVCAFGTITVFLPAAISNPVSWWSIVATALWSFGLVLAACWTMWPPSWITKLLTRSVAVAVGLAVMICLGRFRAAIDPTPNAVHIWLVVGSAVTLAGFILVVLQRGSQNLPFPSRTAVVWIGILLATWFVVAADPMLIALALVGSVVEMKASAERARTVVLAGLAVLVPLEIGLAVVGLSDSALRWRSVDAEEFWLVFMGAVAIEAVVLLMIRPAPFRLHRDGTLRRLSAFGIAACWTVLWGVAPLPWAVEAASRAGLRYVEGIDAFVIVGSSLLSILLGLAGLGFCRLVGAPCWVIRLALALPVLAGIVAAVPGTPVWGSWLPAALLVLVLVAVAPRRREHARWSDAFRSRNCFHAGVLVGGAWFMLALLGPVLASVVADLMSSAFADAGLLELPYPIRVTLLYRDELADLFGALQTPAALSAALCVGGVLLLAWAGSRILASRGLRQPGITMPSVDARRHGVDFLAALAIGLLLTNSARGHGDAEGFRPGLAFTQVDFANLAGAVLSVLIVIYAWRWRFGSADWLALVLILSSSIISLPNARTDPGNVIGLLLAALFVGGPTTVFASRRSGRLLDIGACVLAAVLCGLASELIPTNWAHTVVGDFEVPAPVMAAVLFLPALIVRPSASSSTSARIERFKRAGRRIAAIVIVWMLLYVAVSQLQTASYIQAGLISASGGQLWLAFFTTLGTAVLIAFVVWGWLHLGVLVIAAGALDWRWSRHLANHVARVFEVADLSVAPVMKKASSVTSVRQLVDRYLDRRQALSHGPRS